MRRGYGRVWSYQYIRFRAEKLLDDSILVYCLDLIEVFPSHIVRSSSIVTAVQKNNKEHFFVILSRMYPLEEDSG